MELRNDSSRIILTADKGVAVVVVDRKYYIDKATNLLVQPAYRTIDRDSTNKLKAKLITILRRIKRETGLEGVIYKYFIAHNALPQSFMDFQRSIKLTPPQAYSIKQRLSYLWGSQSSCQDTY